MKTDKFYIGTQKQNDDENVMDYNQHHLKNFIKNRPALSVSVIEKNCKIPIGTLRHFLKARRNLPLKHFELIENELLKYGYTPLKNE